MKLEFSAKLKSILDGTSNVYSIVNSIDDWDEVKIRSFINESFYNIINYVYIHVPYYHKLFIDFGLNPTSFIDISELSKIPILRKDIIRSNYDLLRSDEIQNIKYQKRRSGGTTGEPITSLISAEATAYETFSYFKGLRWMGLKPEMTFVKLVGGSLGIGRRPNFRQKIYNYSTNSILLPAFELRSDTIGSYYNSIKNEKKICILGYASAINIFVDLLKSKKFQLRNVKLVITTSDQLIEDWRNNIQTYFNCEIRSYYGCGEILSLGYQLLGGNQNYKVPKEHVFIESDPVTNELYVTQLHNKAQPLIRYAVGDLGVISKSDLWSIETLLGRTSDLFTRKDGVQISPNFGAHAILKSGIPVKQYQYIQYIDSVIEFRYTMENGKLTTEHKGILQKIIDYVMGEPTTVVFRETDQFVKNSSGKHRITVKMDIKFPQ